LSEQVFRLCPAKLNLALSVGAARPDGYHPIASWMLAVDLCDELRLDRLDTGPSRFDLDWATDAPQPSAIDWPVDKDLTCRAHRLLESHTGCALPVGVRLAKRIPVGAGLAGGSSNGAAMLAALNDLFDLQLSRQTLIHLAMQLGSDLAFFFTAGSAIVTGRGETLDEAPLTRSAHFVLVLPALHCPTGAVYRAFDETCPDAAVDEPAVREVHADRRDPFNDLAAPACDVEPRLDDLRRSIASRVDRAVHVTGSGAGLFIVAADAAEAADLADAIREQVHTPALVVQPATIESGRA